MASHGMPRPLTTEKRTEQTRLKELKRIKEYRELVSLIEEKVAEQQYTKEVLELTSKLLKENPEYYTIWNIRRRLLIYGLFSKPLDSSLPSTESQTSSLTDTITVSSEDSSKSSSPATPLNPPSQNPGKNGTTLELIVADLEFLVPLLMQYPKCYWIWNYRLWLLDQAKERLDVPIAKKLWEQELGLVGKMLTRDSRNFHGWRYRRLVVSQLEGPELEGHSMVEQEFEYTTKMIRINLSNFSAWHARSKLIPRLLNERKADDETRKQFLDNEFDIMNQALWTDPMDQSLWFYQQFLMTTLTDYVGHATITPNLTTEDRIEYVTRQLVNVKDMLDGAEDCKWIYNALVEYTIALWRMQGRSPGEDEKQEVKLWLDQLRELDPLRAGKWDDIEKSLIFNRE
ncbi:geranylgeranyl transferase-like protein type II alpha subunit [Xylogone sp. PMI_703]|nr:geranylgeranyl transferase-like protein type II alpha subunit [Xylogone sp. PMI_703]